MDGPRGAPAASMRDIDGTIEPDASPWQCRLSWTLNECPPRARVFVETYPYRPRYPFGHHGDGGTSLSEGTPHQITATEWTPTAIGPPNRDPPACHRRHPPAPGIEIPVYRRWSLAGPQFVPTGPGGSASQDSRPTPIAVDVQPVAVNRYLVPFAGDVPSSPWYPNGISWTVWERLYENRGTDLGHRPVPVKMMLQFSMNNPATTFRRKNSGPRTSRRPLCARCPPVRTGRRPVCTSRRPVSTSRRPVGASRRPVVREPPTGRARAADRCARAADRSSRAADRSVRAADR